jgi:hypothetical protein
VEYRSHGGLEPLDKDPSLPELGLVQVRIRNKAAIGKIVKDLQDNDDPHRFDISKQGHEISLIG